MRSLRKIGRQTLTYVWVFSVFILAGCEHAAPNQPREIIDQSLPGLESQNVHTEKFRRLGTRLDNFFDSAITPAGSEEGLTQTSSGIVTFRKSKDRYNGVTIQHPSGASLVILPGTLIPPDYIPWGDPVTITMTVERDADNNQLIYSFGPSGCQFKLPTSLFVSWELLGSESADLFYINNDGTLERQPYDGINILNKTYLLLIKHFSRYAVAYSN